jgi:hypothetical protein
MVIPFLLNKPTLTRVRRIHFRTHLLSKLNEMELKNRIFKINSTLSSAGIESAKSFASKVALILLFKGLDPGLLIKQAHAILYLATSPEVDGLSGGNFLNPIRLYFVSPALRQAIAHNLWD